MSALDVQVGGDHYRSMKIQPVEFVLANGIGFIEGCVIKYVSRWKSKGGVADLRKARHFLDMLIEHVDPAAEPTSDELLAEASALERRSNELRNRAYTLQRQTVIAAVYADPPGPREEVTDE